jgi:hypothetical protein
MARHESSVVDESADRSKVWLSRVEDKLDSVIELLRDLQAGNAADAVAAATNTHVRMRLQALAVRLQQIERQRRSS